MVEEQSWRGWRHIHTLNEVFLSGGLTIDIISLRVELAYQR